MIPVLPLRFRFQAAGPLRLPPYPGSLWRGALGARLRRDACITGAAHCEGCPVRVRCAYGRLFEPPAGAEADALVSRFRDLPRPLVVSPEGWSRRRRPGARLGVEIILVGAAAKDLPALRRAVARLKLHDTALELVEGHALPPDGAEPVLLDGNRGVGPWPIPLPPAPHRARITLEHPLRLRSEGRYLDAAAFSFSVMFTTLLRRAAGLAATVGDGPPEVDFAALKRAAGAVDVTATELEWFDWSRHSARQGRRVPMGGLLGAFTLAGDLAPLWPWLWAGQWLHVGKGAVMGLGRYRAEPLA